MINIEWAKLLLTLATFLATFVWGYWTWLKKRDTANSAEEKRVAVQYLNPYIIACENLQSRLWNILDNNAIEVFKQQDFENGKIGHAEITLYQIMQYFGYERIVLRYGPSAQDPKFIALVNRLRGEFASDRYEIGPFCFFRHRQEILGRLMVKRERGESCFLPVMISPVNFSSLARLFFENY